ncbi:MAG TPA: hypothetical protein VGH57_10870 [Amycolatopsis sp.]|jgi:hypothetical protein
MSDLHLDAVRAEVAYRVGELQKARGSGRPRPNRAVRWLRAYRLTSVAVPAQERREAVRTASDARSR